MSRRHADIWSHPGRYLVDPHNWPWSPNGHGHGHEWPTPTPFVQCQLALPSWDTTILQNLTMKILGQDHACSQRSRSHLIVNIQRSRSWPRPNPMVTHLRPWVQSICLLFVSWQSDQFWLRYSKLLIWHWKFKVKVMAKVKPNGHIWGLEFNRYVCFSCRGNRTIFGWDTLDSIFDFENSRSRSRRKSTKI